MKQARAHVLLLAFCAGCQMHEEAPPAPPVSPFVQSVLSNPHFKWQSISSEHFTLHASKESFALTRLPDYTTLAENTRGAVLQRLGITDTTSTRTDLFFVDTNDDIKAIVGQKAGGWTEASANAVLFVVSRENGPPIRHELGHLYSHRNWGAPSFPWVSEGVAEYAVGDCEGAPLAAWMKSIVAFKVDVPLPVLESNFDYTRAAPTLEAGSFVGYVAQQYGLAAARELFLNGLSALNSATGSDAVTIERSWRMAAESMPGQTELDPRGRVRCES